MIDALTGLGSERGYAPGFKYLSEYPMGVGLGATSSAAELAGLSRWGQVVDANLMRIAADLGIIGLLAFIFVLGRAGLSALRTAQPVPWLTFLLAYLVVMIGTNTLDSYYVSHVFWFGVAAIEGNRAYAKAAAASLTEARAGSHVIGLQPG
jgi:hypothetical protein